MGTSVTGADIATWAGIAGVLLTQIGVFVRVSNAIAVNARRLDQMEQWQKEKSIDRKELEAVEKGAVAGCSALQGRIEATLREHDGRMIVMEREAKDHAKVLSDLRLDVARIPEQLRRQDDMQDLRHKAVEHSLGNLKMMINALAKRAGVLVPADVDDL